MADYDREVLEYWRPRLRRMAAGMVTNPSWAEDLAQEAWIALWRAMPSYDGHMPYEPWCFGVARNRIRNVIREAHAVTHDQRREVSVGSTWELDLLGVTEELETLHRSYHEGEIAKAVDALPPGYRDYVIKRFWQGYTTTELQKTMSPSIWPRVKKRLTAELAHLVS